MRMPFEPDRNCACTREEADVLSMIKAWPGVPAIVTYSPEEGWCVATDPAEVERRSAQTAGVSCQLPPRT